MDDIFLNAINDVKRERNAVKDVQAGLEGVQGTEEPQPQGNQEPGFLQRVFNEVTGDHPAPVEGVDFGTDPKSATELLGDSLEKETQMGRAVIGGGAKAVIETNDFLREMAGQPVTEDQKSPIRKAIEAEDAYLRDQSAVNGVASSVSQFVTGIVGAGKLMAPIKAAKWFQQAGKAATLGYEVVRGAAAGAIVMDPHEERLSNLVQEFPALENPVTEYLAASPDDGYAEGRIKNALEGAGMDIALTGAFAAGLKAIKLARGGDQEGARAVVEQLADQKSVDELVATEQKPRVRVQAGSQEVPTPTVSEEVSSSGVVAPEAKPRVRVKAGKEGEPNVQLQEQTAASVDGEPIISAETKLPEGVEPVKPGAALEKGVSSDQLSEILKKTDFDLTAMEWAGGKQAAAAQGYKFATDASIPWQKLNTAEDVSALITNAETVLRPELNAAKGGAVLSDAAVERQVRNAAKFFNEDPMAVIGEIAKAGDAAQGMVRSMEAGYLVSTRMFMDAHDVVNKIRWGNLEEFGGDAAKAVAETRRRMSLAFEAMGAAQSIRANAGRTLRRMRGEFGIKPENLKQLNSLDDKKFMDLMESTGGDPAKLKELAKPGFLKRVMDEAQFAQRNGMLWNWPTHVVNLTGNVYMQIARPLEKTIGSFVLSGGKAVRQQAAKEFYYTVAAITDGWKAGAEAFMKGDSKLAPHQTDWLNTSSASTSHPELGMPNFKPFDSWENLWHNLHVSSLYRNVTGLPTRALGAQDEFFKTLRYRSVVQARAAMSGDKIGLGGSELKDFIEQRLQRAFDDEGRAIDREALAEAQTSTFNQELLKGTLGKGINDLRSNFQPLGFVLPFVKTPINVLRYAHKYTPGLNLLQKEYRQMALGKLGVEQQAQAMGQMSLGTLFMGSVGLMAANGRVTGGGPSDPKLKKQLLEQGWKPYSVMVQNKDGSTTYVPYGRFDPVGLPMGIMADLHELYTVDPDNLNIKDASTATAIALAKSLTRNSIFNFLA